VAGDGRATEISPPVYAVRLPADAETAGVSAGEQIQDVYRLGWRPGLHAAVYAEGVWCTARTGGRDAVQIAVHVKVDSPSIELLPRILSIDDGPGKPENIQRFIGKKPIAAFGNSDGDIQMLEWTGSNIRPNLELLVHHTDAEREYAYDRNSSMGRLDKGLTEAAQKHWIVVDMKADWKAVFPPPAP